jgi:hypothetical protein
MQAMLGLDSYHRAILRNVNILLEGRRKSYEKWQTENEIMQQGI